MKLIQIQEFLAWIPWKKYSESEIEYLHDKLGANALTIDGCKAAVVAYHDLEDAKKYLPAKGLVSICWEQVKKDRGKSGNGKDAKIYHDLPNNFQVMDFQCKNGHINAVSHPDGRYYQLIAVGCTGKSQRMCLVCSRILTDGDGQCVPGESVFLWADEFDPGWEGVFDERLPHRALDTYTDAIRETIKAERERHTSQVAHIGEQEENPW